MKLHFNVVIDSQPHKELYEIHDNCKLYEVQGKADAYYNIFYCNRIKLTSL